MTEERLPTWQRRALYTWIAAKALYYYANFTHTFYQANKSAITALLERLF